MSTCAPVVLFAYNRPEHTKLTVEALAANRLAESTSLYVFCDGPKNDAAEQSTAAVRSYVRSITGFRNVTVNERERNLGLANSVIEGVSQVIAEHGSAIVVEDDVVTSTDFLAFMNFMLDHHRDEPRVFSVTGFNRNIDVPAGYAYDVYYSYRPMSWGWGTWVDRWTKTDWNVTDYHEFVSSRDERRRFNRGGDDLTDMLSLQMLGKIDSWAIRFAYAQFRNDALTAMPVRSRVFNIGFDGSGVHCSTADPKQTALAPQTVGNWRVPESVEPDPYYVRQMQRSFHVSVPRRIAHTIKWRYLR